MDTPVEERIERLEALLASLPEKDDKRKGYNLALSILYTEKAFKDAKNKEDK